MKILHVNTHASGGAFNGVYRLSQALIKEGVDSKILVKELPSNTALHGIYSYNEAWKKFNFFSRLKSNLGHPVTLDQKKWHFLRNIKGEYEIISLPFSDIDITRSDCYIKADIIHLHWIAEYLDYQSFFKKNKKPIVWTLRDSFPMLGVFHLQNDLVRNSDVFMQLENKMATLKKRAIQHSKSPIEIVGLSKWLTNYSKSSEVFKGFHHHVIPNCINTDDFKPLDKKEARKILRISDEKIVFCFVTESDRHLNKGYSELLEALGMIKSRNLELLSFGKSISLSCHYTLVHRYLGRLSSEELATVFSASDAFIFPTREESLGNVMLEAMACGLPVIGSPVGGLLDVIIPGFNGILCKDLSVVSLKEAIERFIQIRGSFNHESIRQYIRVNYSESLIASKYIDIYERLLGQ